METKLDLRGLKCPLPALKTVRALARLDEGDVLVVEATDPLAEIDIPNAVREAGGIVERADVLDGALVVRVVKVRSPTTPPGGRRGPPLR